MNSQEKLEKDIRIQVPNVNEDDVIDIPGLTLFKNVITLDEENEIVSYLQNLWNNEKKQDINKEEDNDNINKIQDNNNENNNENDENTEIKNKYKIEGIKFYHNSDEKLNITQNNNISNKGKKMNRRVAHFGSIDYSKNCEDIPECCNNLFHRLQKDFPEHLNITNRIKIENKECKIIDSFPFHPDQLTVNEYLPGQGIRRHIDTIDSFAETLISISLSGGCIMKFRLHIPSLTDEEKELYNINNNNNNNNNIVKHLYFPPRSLLIMKGDSRWKWTHSIPMRQHDLINDNVTPREYRISLTFRKILPPLPPNKKDLIPTEIEMEHVHNVYNDIALHWNMTRGRRKAAWKKVIELLESLEPGSLVGDIGCGDGKYLGLRDDIIMIGCDRSFELLKTCPTASLYNTICLDALNIPFLDNIFDVTMSIAVLHHLSTEGHRLQIIRELKRVTKLNGIIFIQAWAKEQSEGSRQKFNESDNLVPWHLQEKYINDLKVNHAVEDKERKLYILQRFCHVYEKGELENLCSMIPGLELIESGWTRSNWYVKLIKREEPKFY